MRPSDNHDKMHVPRAHPSPLGHSLSRSSPPPSSPTRETSSTSRARRRAAEDAEGIAGAGAHPFGAWPRLAPEIHGVGAAPQPSARWTGGRGEALEGAGRWEDRLGGLLRWARGARTHARRAGETQRRLRDHCMGVSLEGGG
jgi:hypothetical protein